MLFTINTLDLIMQHFFSFVHIFKINIYLNHIIFFDITMLENLQKSAIQQSSRILEIGCILAVFYISICNNR